MRPSVRLLKPLEAPSLRGSRKALYVCSVCRQDASSCLPSSTQRRHASGSGSTPFTEKLRRRIWGTDNPPGLEDPYGGEGVIAKEWAKRKARYTGAKETSAETGQENVIQQRTEDEFQGENLLGEEFISAATAHDLPRIGHLSQWSDFPPTESDLYQPFVSRKKAMTSAHFRSAAQSVVVELGLLHELKKPLTAACTVPRHDETIWEMIRQCQVKESSMLESRGNFLEFPDQETKDTLFFVFNQLEEPQNPQNENVMAAVDEAEPTESNAVREIDQEEAENEFNDQDPHNEWEESADLEALDAESEPTFESDLTPEQLNETIDTVFSQVLETKKPPHHEGYLQFSLSDPAVKFAFFKRYSQITGHHMQDICAYKAQTVQDVIAHVEKIYCRRTKLAQELRALKDELDIPNLQVHFKRYTKGTHDRDIGRAKLIEEALRERGLLKEQHNKQSKFRL